MTATDEGAALFGAICADPDDDTLRLAYADWLDERGPGRKTCPVCKGKTRLRQGASWKPYRCCHACDGTGTVPDTSGPDRAELIRAQCRMAALRRHCLCGACVKLRGGGQHHNGPCAVDQERDELPDGRSQQAFLRRRESELLERNPQWQHAQCSKIGEGRDCPICGGTGDLFRRRATVLDDDYGSDNTVSRIARWDRGWPLLRCTVAEIGGEVDGRFVRSPWAEAVATSAGGLWVGVEVQGVEPSEWRRRNRPAVHMWCLFDRDEHPAFVSDNIPKWLYDVLPLPEETGNQSQVRCKLASTEAAVRAALNRAAANLIRGAV